MLCAISDGLLKASNAGQLVLLQYRVTHCFLRVAFTNNIATSKILSCSVRSPCKSVIKNDFSH